VDLLPIVKVMSDQGDDAEKYGGQSKHVTSEIDSRHHISVRDPFRCIEEYCAHKHHPAKQDRLCLCRKDDTSNSHDAAIHGQVDACDETALIRS
jgi:hypothetical protein